MAGSPNSKHGGSRSDTHANDWRRREGVYVLWSQGISAVQEVGQPVDMQVGASMLGARKNWRLQMKVYTVRVHVTDQDLDLEVLALNETEARRLTGERLDGIDHNVQWVQP